MTEIVSFNLAFLAKVRGFNEKCDYYYLLDHPKPFKVWDKSKYDFIHVDNLKQQIITSAPYLSQLQKWLREERQCYIQPVLVEQFNPLGGWGYEITYIDREGEMRNTDENEEYETYELALDHAMCRALVII